MNRPFTINSQACHPVVCPVCGGAGTLEAGPPVPLPELQHRIWSAIRNSRFGLTVPAIAKLIYCDRLSGGPEFPKNCVYALIKHANRRLAAAGIKIANTARGVYKIEHIGGAP